MLAVERRGAGDVAGEVVEELTHLVHGIHQGIADQLFDVIPGSAPIRAIHDAVVGTVYLGLGKGGRLLFSAAGRVASLLPDARPLANSPRGATTQAILNGVVGDMLVDRDNPLAIEMGVRLSGKDVALRRDELGRAYPEARARIAVHIHGLTEDIGAWSWTSLKFGVDPRPIAMEQELGLTPVFVRYNTGRHISENGADFDRLMQVLTDEWPVPDAEVVIIGHSMGALVAESAMIRAEETDQGWVSRVRHLVALAAPHHGAGLERVVNRSMAAATRSAVTRSVATFINLRSVGIKDLRHGEIGDGWQDRDPDAVLADRRPPTRLPSHVKVHAIGASLSTDPESWLARRFGDILVTPDSAAGRRADGWEIEPDTVQIVAKASHFDILAHPDVTTHLRRILA